MRAIGRRTRGFTLLELLIASSITVVIAGIILAAFHLASKAWATGQKRGDTTQRTRVVISQMIEEIKSAYPFRMRMYERAGKVRFSRVLLFSGLSDSISFVSKRSGIMGEENSFGLRTVSYFVKRGTSEEDSGLFVREGNPFVEEPFEHGDLYQLDPNVTSISFRYFYDPNIRLRFDRIIRGQQESEPGEWLESWDSYGETPDLNMSVEQSREIARYLPKSVELTLTVRRDDDEVTLGPFLIPVMNRQLSLASGLAEVEQ